ncbi:MAG: LamG-like jellyroll fold domain-containing protein [Candidatus Acetothermia bacterium]
MKATKSTVVVVSLVLIVILSALTPISVSGEPAENVLGYSLGQLLLGWNMLTLGSGVPGEILQGTDLGAVIEDMKTSSEKLDLPQFIIMRFDPLLEKYELSRDEFLWKFQPGYWGFNNEDGLELSGARIASDVAESQTRKFRYVGFYEPGDQAVINLSEKGLEAPLGSFTLEFWIRPEGETSGTVLSAGNWVIELHDNTPKVVHQERGAVLVGETRVLSDRWSHLALTSSGEDLCLYLNGRAVGKGELETPLRLLADLTIGGGFIGALDELRIKGKEEARLRLNFDQPIDYFLVYPIAWAARNSFNDDRLWGFYASLLVSGASMNREDKLSAVEPGRLGEIFAFLSGEVEGSPAPPADLPREVEGVLTTFDDVSKKEELSEEDRIRISEGMAELLTYLGLG